MRIICPDCSFQTSVQALDGKQTCPKCGFTLPIGTTRRTDLPAPPDTPVRSETVSSPQDRAIPSTEMVDLPTKLGRYRILGLLGEGGFSHVYLAQDEELERQVALKVPKADRFPTADALAAFFDEARTVAGLEHPNIVKVYDVGEDPSDIHYIVMQYINGAPLHCRTTTSRRPFEASAELVRKVALAVHHAHTKQFFHRDLKPNNILLDSRNEPYVADFGLAVCERSQSQHAGEVAGTVPYMAPEQIRGEAHRLDGRADIWSLGVILYQLLVGRRPFLGEGKEVMDNILHREPRPPRQIDETTPKGLERICLKCLTKSVNERYGSAYDLAEELGEWLEKERDSAAKEASPSSVTDERPAPIDGDKAKRVPRVAWAVALVLLASLIAGGLLIVDFGNPRDGGDPRDGAPVLLSNWDIDRWLPKGRWHALLEQEPRELVWSDAWDAANWNYDTEVQESRIDTPDIGLLSLGQTSAAHYRLQVTIYKSAWIGNAGLFWGYQEPFDEGGQTQCGVLWVSSHPGRKGIEVVVRHDHFVLKPAPAVGRPLVDRSAKAAAQVEVPELRDNELEIEIRNGYLVGVKWRGQKLEDLDASLRDLPLEALPSGQFGIIDERGSGVFRDARILLLEKGATNAGTDE